MKQSLFPLLLTTYQIVIGQIPVSWSNYYSGTGGNCPCPPSHLLDNDLSTMWNAWIGDAGTNWVVFDFGEPIKLFNFSFYGSNDGAHSVKTFEMQYSNESDAQWSALHDTQYSASVLPSEEWQHFDLAIDSQTGYYRYWRWYISERYSSHQAFVYEVEFHFASLSDSPTASPSASPSAPPTATPSAPPTATPSAPPTASPSASPTASPSAPPTASPSTSPTASPSAPPTASPSTSPTASPSASPSAPPTASPSAPPTASPSTSPTASPSAPPTASPSAPPTASPSASPSLNPTASPSRNPTQSPSLNPSQSPSRNPTESSSEDDSASATASEDSGSGSYDNDSDSDDGVFWSAADANVADVDAFVAKKNYVITMVLSDEIVTQLSLMAAIAVISNIVMCCFNM